MVSSPQALDRAEAVDIDLSHSDGTAIRQQFGAAQ